MAIAAVAGAVILMCMVMTAIEKKMTATVTEAAREHGRIDLAARPTTFARESRKKFASPKNESLREACAMVL